VQLLTVADICAGQSILCPDGSIRFRMRFNPAKAKLSVGTQQELKFG
jgi:hypothetical protein